MNRIKIALSILTACASIQLVSPAALADSAADVNAFQAGITYYKRGDYRSAVGYLKRAINGKYKRNASAHYWYGNALLKEKRFDNAIIAFAEAFNLSPHSSVGENSLRMLKYYKTRIKESNSLSNFVKSKLRVQPPMIAPTSTMDRQIRKFKSMNATPEDEVDQKLLRSIKLELKDVQKHQRPGPTMSEFSAWPISQQANYVYAGAYQAIERAKSNVSSAQRQLKEAQARARRLIPSFRSYGDEEGQFQAKKEASKQVYKNLMKPYKKEVEKCQKQLTEAVGIKNRAEQALNTPLYYNPYGYIPR